MPSKSLDQLKQENFDRLENLRLEQAGGESKRIPANKNDKYEIADTDANLLHVRRVTRIWNPATQQPDDREEIQSFSPLFFEKNKQNLTAGYFETEIIHAPEDKDDKSKTKK